MTEILRTENIVDSDKFEQYLISHPFIGKPENLYNAMNYIMQLGGKRVRPKLLLLAYQCVAGKIDEAVLELALAIETFHNFSLIHDDLMDKAPLRRGKKTVHHEWNDATAILAGDNLSILCFQLILKADLGHKMKLLNEFTTMAQQVSEGQQMDMNLPYQEHINYETYLEMIRLKTAVLPATALKMGAIAGGANDQLADSFYDFGLNLGMAFQLQDDYLDCFGSSIETGKQEGGDILENKRTLLYLYALENLKGEERDELKNWYGSQVHDENYKVERVRKLFQTAGSDIYLNKLKSEFEACALKSLDSACGDSVYKQDALSLFNALKQRST